MTAGLKHKQSGKDFECVRRYFPLITVQSEGGNFFVLTLNKAWTYNHYCVASQSVWILVQCATSEMDV